MQYDPKSRLPGEGQTPAATTEVLSADAQSRRRALVKGLGKGGAALAAVAPIRSFADSVDPFASRPIMQTQAGTLCTVSGQHSAVASRGIANAPVCSGHKPSYFVEIKYWTVPASLDGADRTLVTLGAFRNAIGVVKATGMSDDSLKLVDVLADNANADAVFVAAYFNSRDPGVPFPFTELEVVTQYSAFDSAIVRFYTDYVFH